MCNAQAINITNCDVTTWSWVVQLICAHAHVCQLPSRYIATSYVIILYTQKRKSNEKCGRTGLVHHMSGRKVDVGGGANI